MAEVPGLLTWMGPEVPTTHFAHVQVQRVAPLCIAEALPHGRSDAKRGSEMPVESGM